MLDDNERSRDDCLRYPHRIYKQGIILLLLYQAAAYSGQYDCLGSVKGRSYVWVVERQPPSFIIGTLHIPYDRAWVETTLTYVRRLFQGIDRLFVELDVTDANVVSDLRRCQYLPMGTTIQDIAPRKLFRRLSWQLRAINATERCEPISGPNNSNNNNNRSNLNDAVSCIKPFLQDWPLKRPVWIMTRLIAAMVHNIVNSSEPIMDRYLTELAARSHIPVESLESVEEQCSVLNKLNDKMVMRILPELAREFYLQRSGVVTTRKSAALTTFQDTIDRFVCGDLDNRDSSTTTAKPDTMEAPGNIRTRRRHLQRDQSSPADPVPYTLTRAMRESMVVRNKRIASYISEKMRTNSSEMILFALGVGHLGQNADSVLELLRREGFNLTEIPINVTSSVNDSGALLHTHADRPTAQEKHHPYFDDRYIRSLKKVMNDEQEIVSCTAVKRVINKLFAYFAMTVIMLVTV